MVYEGCKLKKFGEVKAKNSSEEALQRWRKLCCLVKNPKRRFRFTANLSKRFEVRAIQRSNQEKLRVAVLVSQAALQFIRGITYKIPEDVKEAGFDICAEELGSIVEGHNKKKLKLHDGVDGIATKLATSVTDGISSSEQLLNKRRKIYGVNQFTESPAKGYWIYVWEALQDMTLMILALCAFVSLVVGITMEGWPKGAQDGLGIVASILLVVFVTATSDYKQSLQFKDLDKEKKKITVQVTRNGFRQEMSIYDLLPGDIVYLAIGDQVPADGLVVSEYSLLIDKSSLTGESEPINVCHENPFLLSGTIVQEGFCIMLITTVGMRTQWGKLMATLSEGGDDETPLQVKLNGVATIIGKIGLFLAVITFAVLVQGLFTKKMQENSISSLPISVEKSITFIGPTMVYEGPKLMPRQTFYRVGPKEVDAFSQMFRVAQPQKDYFQWTDSGRNHEPKDHLINVAYTMLLVSVPGFLFACCLNIIWFILAFILLTCPKLLSAQPTGLTEKEMYGFTSFNPDKRPPHRWSIEKFWGTMVDGTYIIMFAGIILTVWCFYNNHGPLIAYCIYGIRFLIREFDNLMGKIKNLIEKLKKNKIEYLGAVFQLSNIALSSPFLGGAQRWKASMVAGIAVFSIICYCGKVSVELKRAKTERFFYPETRNNKKVLFFTARHVLEFFIPLSYSLLACVYLTELDKKNHHMENDWKSVAFNIQVFIHVIGGLLAFMNARNPYYFRRDDQNQIIPMQPIDTIPRKGNEVILKDKLTVAEELSEEVAAALGCVENHHADVSVPETILVVAEEVEDAHVTVAAHGYVENQSAVSKVSTTIAENVFPEVMSEEGC